MPSWVQWYVIQSYSWAMNIALRTTGAIIVRWTPLMARCIGPQEVRHSILMPDLAIDQRHLLLCRRIILPEENSFINFLLPRYRQSILFIVCIAAHRIPYFSLIRSSTMVVIEVIHCHSAWRAKFCLSLSVGCYLCRFIISRQGRWFIILLFQFGWQVGKLFILNLKLFQLALFIVL